MEKFTKRLRSTNTYARAGLVEGREATGSRWVFSWKVYEYGMIVTARARLVVKGYSQIASVDFNETFAPIPFTSTVKLLAALVTISDNKLFHDDVEQALAQSSVVEEIFIKLPIGPGDD